MEDVFFYVDGVVENGGFVGLYINGVDGRKSLKVEKWRKSVKVEEERRKQGEKWKIGGRTKEIGGKVEEKCRKSAGRTEEIAGRV